MRPRPDDGTTGGDGHERPKALSSVHAARRTHAARRSSTWRALVVVASLVAIGAALTLVGSRAGAQTLPTVTIAIDRGPPEVNDPCAVGGSYIGFRLVVERDVVTGPLTVELEVTFGTPGEDFEPFSTTIAFADGEGSVAVPVVPIQSGGGGLGVTLVPSDDYQVGSPGEFGVTFAIVSCVLPTTTTAPPASTTTTVADTEVEDLDVLPRTGADPNLLLAGAGALTTGTGLWLYRTGRRCDRPRRRPF